MSKRHNEKQRFAGGLGWKRWMIVGLALFLVSQASAGVVVIVSPDSDISGLSKSQIKSIFLGKVKSLPNGDPAAPVNQAEESPVYDAFNKKVLGKSSTKVLQYWASRVFSGKGSPPEVLPDDQAVINYVRSTKGAIGYIDSSAAKGDVKVIYSAD